MLRKQACAQLVSRIVRFKLILTLGLCCLAGGGAMVLLPASNAMSAGVSLAPAAPMAVTPTNGTLTDTSGPLTFTGGPS